MRGDTKIYHNTPKDIPDKDFCDQEDGKTTACKLSDYYIDEVPDYKKLNLLQGLKANKRKELFSLLRKIVMHFSLLGIIDISQK